jgi:hypothetical protein
MTIEQSGENVKGTLKGEAREVSFEGTVKGNHIRFTVKQETPRGETTVEYSGAVEDDIMKGTRKGPRGETPWWARRAT